MVHASTFINGVSKRPKEWVKRSLRNIEKKLQKIGDSDVILLVQVVCQHRVKVYAPGAPGAPPMSMPHLDYRTIGGKDGVFCRLHKDRFPKFSNLSSVLHVFLTCFETYFERYSLFTSFSLGFSSRGIGQNFSMLLSHRETCESLVPRKCCSLGPLARWPWSSWGEIKLQAATNSYKQCNVLFR